MKTLIRLALILGATTAGSEAAAQTLNYGGTVFVHGLADAAGRWVNPILGGASPFDRYNAIIDTRVHSFPQLTGSAPIATQQGELASHLGGVGGLRVVVGHSMGGVVARSAQLNGAPNVAAIITIASPHQGSLAADNAAKYHFFVNKMGERIRGVITLLASVSLGTGGYILSIYVNDKFVDPLLAEIRLRLPDPASGAVSDLRVGSSALAALNADTRDAVLPRANVVGQVPVRNVALRLTASSTGRDFNDLNQIRKWSMSVLKGCKHTGFFTIIAPYLARKCSLAYKHFARIDGRFLLWVTGPDPWGRPRNVPFDGIVATERANYPGLDPLQNIISASATSDHFGVLGDGTRITEAMGRVGMRTKP